MAYDSIIQALLVTRKVFVSYHHGGDRAYYDEFSRIFHETYEACLDNSVDRLIDSPDSEYVIRRIREDYIAGTSCTIVLCGAGTMWRKFVDWEIKATLDKNHALLGVNLPSNPRDVLGKVQVPQRLWLCPLVRMAIPYSGRTDSPEVIDRAGKATSADTDSKLEGASRKKWLRKTCRVSRRKRLLTAQLGSHRMQQYIGFAAVPMSRNEGAALHCHALCLL
jgi:hypothetical protein